MHFQGYLIDLDDTLYDYQSVNKIALSYTFEKISLELQVSVETAEQSFLNARSQINIELSGTAASHNRLLYIQRMLEILGVSPVSYSLELYEYYWSTLLDHIVVNESVYDFLDLIKDKKVCILTDLTAHIQHRKIKKLNIDSHINYLVTSEEAGHEKPHPYMFLLAARKMKLNVNEMCMIGDNYEKDILGASRLGIEAYLYNPSSNKIKLPKNAHSFKSFSELVDWR
ncbi:HAD family hydrolase [Paenibacillus sp. FSL R7-0333]|uniref:HAD family hydrolase n=1 Tax=Paenibacillus sp. FSL R7-0333 TaxID=1926587 RepID=UPI00096FD00A|nr:hypothetical protein BK146_27660 [Paenibacillus sp. FSL R7-0333]